MGGQVAYNKETRELKVSKVEKITAWLTPMFGMATLFSFPLSTEVNEGRPLRGRSLMDPENRDAIY